jgi:hypothetical protein
VSQICCDGTKIQYELCTVAIHWRETESYCWEGRFFYLHNHSYPPHQGKNPDRAAKALAKVVYASLEARPKQLKLGTTTRKPVTDLRESFINGAKLSYERGKVLKGTKPESSMSSILSFLLRKLTRLNT